jgi:hypothetical protein
MNKKNNPVIPLALLLSAISGVVCAVDIPRKAQGNQEFTVAASEYLTRTPYHSVKTVYSDCHRNRVIWSGGIARRGPDRIGPRPIRSRWQGTDESRIYCSGGNPFSQKRVADEPWIR